MWKILTKILNEAFHVLSSNILLSLTTVLDLHLDDPRSAPFSDLLQTMIQENPERRTQAEQLKNIIASQPNPHFLHRLGAFLLRSTAVSVSETKRGIQDKKMRELLEELLGEEGEEDQRKGKKTDQQHSFQSKIQTIEELLGVSHETDLLFLTLLSEALSVSHSTQRALFLARLFLQSHRIKDVEKSLLIQKTDLVEKILSILLQLHLQDREDHQNEAVEREESTTKTEKTLRIVKNSIRDEGTLFLVLNFNQTRLLERAEILASVPSSDLHVSVFPMIGQHKGSFKFSSVISPSLKNEHSLRSRANPCSIPLNSFDLPCDSILIELRSSDLQIKTMKT